MRGRPGLITSYSDDIALFRTGTQKFWLMALLGFALWAPLWLPNDWLFPATIAMFAAIGAIGLNLVTGYAGQVSLGHVGFYAIGAYAVAILTTDAGISF